MEHYEEHQDGRTIVTKQELVVRCPEGEYRPMDFQPAFDVLKAMNLDCHISDEERRFLQVQ